MRMRLSLPLHVSKGDMVGKIEHNHAVCSAGADTIVYDRDDRGLLLLADFM